MINDLGIYIHIPYCKHKCSYCSFVSTVNLASEKEYVSKLIKEIENSTYAGEVTSIYIGGGTPSALYDGAITEIFQSLREKFVISEDCEITVEANPESATEKFIAECVNCGVNRLSIGLQCANDDVLQKAGRIHSVNDFVVAVKTAYSHGIANVSGDIIIGLKGETRKDLIESLSLLISLQVKHISVYSLSVEKGCIMFKSDFRPDEDYMADEYSFCSDFLRRQGYERYEISNFSLSGYRAAHNTKYWLHKPYIGFGVAAHSFFGGERFSNTEKLSEYLNGVTCVSREKITLKDLREEFIMLRLRLREGIDLSEYEKTFNENFEESRSNKLEELYRAGVLEKTDGTIRATDKGVYVLNYIITELI